MKDLMFAAAVSILLTFSLANMSRYNYLGNMYCAPAPVATAAFFEAGYHSKDSGGKKEKSDSPAAGTLQPEKAASSVSAKGPAGLSLPDILGAIFLLALIVTHFFLCKKGVYPESFALCNLPFRSKNRPGEDDPDRMTGQ